LNEPIQAGREQGAADAAALEFVLHPQRLHQPDQRDGVKPEERVCRRIAFIRLNGEVECRVIERALAQARLGEVSASSTHRVNAVWL
jgi:hypothetical protein